jgi:hypothetical protein
MLTANLKTKRMDAYLSGGGFVEGVCDLIYPKKIIRFIDDSRDHILVINVINHFETKEIRLPLKALSSQESTHEALLAELFFVSFKFVNFIREYVEIYLQEKRIEDITIFKHSNLGFYDFKGQGLFLLEKNQFGQYFSEFYDTEFSFTKGSEAKFKDMIDRLILPSKEMSFALTIGLSSVVASYLKDYADIQNLIINICGQSSTGKTTAAMFIASLWASPVISNRGLVRTFNATPTSIITSIEGINGVPIILDDITTSGNSINKTSFLYTLAQGESKARSTTNGRLQFQGPKWSGTILITSETPVLSESETRQGLLARVIDTNDIVWTDSSEHSESIKKQIINHYGFIGKSFVSAFIALEESDIKAKFDLARDELSDLMSVKDNLSNRIINKLAVLYLTAKLIKELLRFERFNVDLQRDLIVSLDQAKAMDRHPAEAALRLVIEYVVEHYHNFNISVEGERLRALAKSKIYGEVRYEGKTITVVIPTHRVKAILESNRLFDIKPIFIYWRDHGLIKPEETKRSSVKDARFSVRVIKFKLNLDQEGLFPLEKEINQDPPEFKSSFEGMTEDQLFEHQKGEIE